MPRPPMRRSNRGRGTNRKGAYDMQTTTTIHPGLAENAVMAYRLAAGLTPALTARDHRRCARLADECQRGTLTRDDIDARLQDIAGVSL